MAARAFFTLDYLGLEHVSVLNGGLDKWRAELRPLTRNATRPTRGHLEPHPRPEDRRERGLDIGHEGQPGVSLIDTENRWRVRRRGGATRMPSEGHIAGAKQLQWEQLFADPATGRFPRVGRATAALCGADQTRRHCRHVLFRGHARECDVTWRRGRSDSWPRCTTARTRTGRTGICRCSRAVER